MDKLQQSIDEICAPWDRRDSPGCVVAVLRQGELLHRRGYGMADLERGVPLSSSSLLDIGSLSKQFTAMCIALLARQGKLSLDDDIRAYLPEMPRYDAAITVRHLVHHTSGVREYGDLLALAGRRHLDASAADVLALLQRQRGLNFLPGEKFQYSNSGYVLLAAIIARAAGRSLQDYAEAVLFQPLGMSSTAFVAGGRQGGGRMALAYAPLEDGGFTVDASGINLAGDAGVLTTAEDLCRWELNFYDNRILEGGPELMEQIVTPGRLNDGKALSYACGLFRDHLDGRLILHHGGNFAGYEVELVRCPEQRLSVLCLANLGTFKAGDVARRIASLCLVDAAPTPGELGEYAGFYASEELAVVHQLRHEQGQLLVQMPDIPFPLPLKPTARDEFAIQGATVRFRRDPEARISGFSLSSPGVRELRFTLSSGVGESVGEQALEVAESADS